MDNLPQEVGANNARPAVPVKYLAPPHAPYTSHLTRELSQALHDQDPTGRAHLNYWFDLAEANATLEPRSAVQQIVAEAESYDAAHPVFRNEDALTNALLMVDSLQCAVDHIRHALSQSRILNLTRENTTTNFLPPTEADDAELAQVRLRHSQRVWEVAPGRGNNPFRFYVYLPYSHTVESIGFRTYAPYTGMSWARLFSRYALEQRIEGLPFLEDGREYYNHPKTAGHFESFLDEHDWRREHWEWCYVRFSQPSDNIELDNKFMVGGA